MCACIRILSHTCAVFVLAMKNLLNIYMFSANTDVDILCVP